MSFSETLFAAVVADLTAVSELSAVYDEPRKPENSVMPYAALVPGRGGSAEGRTQNRGESTQEYEIGLAFESSDPRAKGRQLLDAVRNQMESESSNLRATSASGHRVERADITDWSEVLTSEDVRNHLGAIVLTLAVRYVYTRGSL